MDLPQPEIRYYSSVQGPHYKGAYNKVSQQTDLLIAQLHVLISYSYIHSIKNKLPKYIFILVNLCYHVVP